MSTAVEGWQMCEISPQVDAKRAHEIRLDAREDVELVSLARAGETYAFEELVRRYRNDVFALAYHFVQNREDAWDISQEVFIKAHRSLRGFRGDSSFKTWLMHITTNQCKDHLKTRRIRTVELDDSVRAGVETHHPDRSAEANEIGQAILSALAFLPFKHRTVFILREFEGMSYEEMARVMGCTIGTVMSRLHHARRKLRERLLGMGVRME